MHDDREEFEQDQILRDRELTDEEIQWMHDQNESPERALARLGAEMAAHEPPAEAIPPEPVVMDFLTGTEADLTGASKCAEPAAQELRFGGRLRRMLRSPTWSGGGMLLRRQEVRSEADAVDLDAKRQRDEEAERLGYVRTRVEEAVERLRYSVGGNALDVSRDILDAEPFLDELDRIFGERPEQPRVPVALPDRAACHFCGFGINLNYDGAKATVFRLPGDIPVFVHRDCLAQHEPAHDRRERESARQEDRSGRVEGVDR